MISKATRGKGFSGSISYIAEKSSCVVMRNLIGSDWKKSAAQMRLTANAHPKSQKPVYHSWLSFSPDEKLSNEQMIEAMDHMIHKLGLSDHQHVMAIHRDVDHWHIHCVSNLISPDGRYNHVDHDFKKRPVFARQIESELGLKKFHRTSRAKISEQQYQEVFSDDRISSIQSALHSSNSFAEFSESLSQIGFQIAEKSSRDNKLNYRIIDVESGAYIAGSKVDPALTSPSSVSKKFTPPFDAISLNNDDRASEIRSIIDNASSWDNAQINLDKVGIKLEFAKSGERVRGIRFHDVETGESFKASEIGISYSQHDKRFSEMSELSEDTGKTKKPYDKPYDEYKKFCIKIWKEFKAIEKKKPDESKLKRISDARNSEVYFLKQKAWKEIQSFKRMSFLERFLVSMVMGFDAIKNAESIIQIDLAKKMDEIDKRYGAMRKELYDDTNINLQSFLIQKQSEGVNPLFIQKFSAEILEKDKERLLKNNQNQLINLIAKHNKIGEGVFYQHDGKNIIFVNDNKINLIALDETTLVTAIKLSEKTKMPISGTTGVLAAVEQYQKDQFLRLQQTKTKKADPRSRTAQPAHVESVPQQKEDQNVNVNRVGGNRGRGRDR